MPFFERKGIQGFANRVSEKELEGRAAKARKAGEDSDLHGLEGAEHEKVILRIKEARRSGDEPRAKRIMKDFDIPEFLLDEPGDIVA